MPSKSAVVIDCGSGFSKFGYSGNLEPSFVIPAQVAVGPGSTKSDYIGDMDFFMGDELDLAGPSYSTQNPMAKGAVTNWNQMERVWHRAIYHYLRCNPEEHAFLLENREYAAEVMFETFNVPFLYIANQATLSLAAASTLDTGGVLPDLSTISGVAVESGDGVTSIVPVAFGYTIGSAIRTIPVAGKDITRFVVQMLKDRKEPVTPDVSMQVGQHVKETYCYAALKKMVKEYHKFDKSPEEYFKTYEYDYKGKKVTLDIGYEQFLGPEALFHPEIVNPKISPKGLPELVDEAVLACPIDVRRSMYKNVVLSGGNSLFRKLASRLERDIKGRVDKRLRANAERLAKSLGRKTKEPPKLDVNVVKMAGSLQKYAVWLGGSLLSEQDTFVAACLTKEKYDEEGPRIARAAR